LDGEWWLGYATKQKDVGYLWSAHANNFDCRGRNVTAADIREEKKEMDCEHASELSA
jgi:hypothetical protein